MKKNRLFFVLATVLTVAAVIFACQRTEMAGGDEGLMLKTATNCGSCVANWIDSKETYTIGTNVYIDVWNDRTNAYFKVYRTGGATIGNISHDGGSNIGFSPAVTEYTVTKPVNVVACTKVTTVFNSIGGLGGAGGKIENITQNYYLRELCTSTALTTDKFGDVCIGEVVNVAAEVSATETVGFGTLTIYKDGVAVATGVSSASYQYTVVAGSAVFTAKYVGAGGYASSEAPGISVNGIECGCEESFTYVNNNDGTYTFKYVPKDDMPDAVLVFTFAQGIVMSGLADWTTNGQTKQRTMSLEKCKEYTWTVTLDCKLNSGAQNLWTDFKVNDVSLKGTLPNIKCD